MSVVRFLGHRNAGRHSRRAGTGSVWWRARFGERGEDGGDGRRVGRFAVRRGVDAAAAAGDLCGVHVRPVVGLEREAGLGGHADAGGDEGLHDDDVVAVRGDARGEALALARGAQLGLAPVAPRDPGGVAMVREPVVGAPAEQVERVVADVQPARWCSAWTRWRPAGPVPRAGRPGRRARWPLRRRGPRSRRPGGPGAALRASAGSRGRLAGRAWRRWRPPGGTGGDSPTAGSSAALALPRSPIRAGRRRPAP